MANDLVAVGGGQSPDFAEIMVQVEAIIERIGTIADARDAIDNMGHLEDVLKAQRVFKECARDFCRLEAELWAHIASTIPVNHLKGVLSDKEMGLVSWLRKKSANDIRAVIDECATGIRISRVRRSEMSKATRAANEREYERISAKILDEGVKSGVTTLSTSRFRGEWSLDSKPSDDAIRGYTEFTRDRLIRAGLNSLGDDTGTYMSTERGNLKEKSLVLSNLIRNIMACISKLADTAEELGVAVPEEGVRQMEAAVRRLGCRGREAA